ncbi:MAG: alpha-1,2-fucosyltransferase [Candidatus Lokiarchaeia archaeon]
MKEILKNRIFIIIDFLNDLFWHLGQSLKPGLNLNQKLPKLFNKISILRKISAILYGKFATQKKIVSIRIRGGLGNQLYQIATVLAYAWRFSLIPQFKKIKQSPSRVRPRPVYWDTVFRKIPTTEFRPFNLIIYQEKNLGYHKIPNPNKIANLNNCNGIKLNGYFQNEQYFDDYRERLLKILFFIDLQEKKKMKTEYPEIFDKNKITISLHIRRDDNVSHKVNYMPYLWDSDYYAKSLSYFIKKFGIENILIVVVSDDQTWSKNYFKNEFPELNPIIPNEKDYLDLYLMSCCEHQIIANSSFSWWAAYLNQNPNKIVIAPKNWEQKVNVKSWDWRYMDNWLKF